MLARRKTNWHVTAAVPRGTKRGDAEFVCRRHGLLVEQLASDGRNPSAAIHRARGEVCVLMRDKWGMSWEDIRLEFGIPHASAQTAVRRFFEDSHG